VEYDVDSEVDTGIEVLAADDVSRAGAAVCYTYAVTLSGPVQPRDAAAIALHVGGPEPRVLWVRRSPSAPFLAGYYDFPSGHAHACDATAPATGGDDVALRVTGLRELFEEAGVLVVEPPATRAQERELPEAFAGSAEVMLSAPQGALRKAAGTGSPVRLSMNATRSARSCAVRPSGRSNGSSVPDTGGSPPMS
jgi:hypothetical protein